MTDLAFTPDDLTLLTTADLAAFHARGEWIKRANHPKRAGKQIPPAGLWNVLLWISGRGFGKTEALSQVLWWDCWRIPGLIAHYLAATLSDVRGVVFEGPTGLCTIVPPECVREYTARPAQMILINGSIIKGFATTEEAERLRGPQCHVLAGDELATWDRPAGNMKAAFDNAMLGLRLPYPDRTPSRAYFGTTPKPIPFLKSLMKRRDVRTVRGTTYENLDNLSENYRDTLLALEGTTVGRQEIHGEVIDLEEMGIFKRSWFRLWPKDKKLPEFRFIVESYDTAASDENYDAKAQETDPSACTVWGLFNVKQCFTELERKRLGVTAPFAVVLCEAWTERLGFPELAERAHKQRRLRWGTGPNGKGRRSDIVLIEDKSSGRQLRQVLVKFGVPATPYNPGRQDKTQRAHAVSPAVAQGMFFVPESTIPERSGMPRDWVEPFLEQVCAFAGRGSLKHDDYVDSFTQAARLLIDKGLLEVTAQRGPPLDAEEERERIEREALKRQGETAERVNPYGV